MSDLSTNNLYLIGFRIEPDIFDPQLYTIYIEGEHPITCSGQPIVFAKPELADAALALSDLDRTRFGATPEELDAVFDIAEAIYVLCEEDEVENGDPLGCINMLLDIANCVDERTPCSHRKTLESLADHLTFNTEFKSFIEGNNITRQEISDAFFWAIGMAVYHMKILK